jgi:hypothetical protein
MCTGINAFLLPIIIYLDKTGTDVYQQFGMEPVLFTVGVIKRNVVRERDACWHVLGFIPNMKKATEEAKVMDTAEGDAPPKNKNSTGKVLRTYHAALSKILEPLSDAQKTDITFPFRAGNKAKFVSLKMPLMMVIGGTLSSDGICARKLQFYGPIPRISRGCYTPGQMSSMLDVDCHPPNRHVIEGLASAALGPGIV